MEESIGDHIESTTSHFIKLENEIFNINGTLPNLPGKWSGGSYCILANGACPAGFTRYEGNLRAIPNYSCNQQYLTEGRFGDSYIIKHHNCENDWHSDIRIVACCK